MKFSLFRILSIIVILMYLFTLLFFNIVLTPLCVLYLWLCAGPSIEDIGTVMTEKLVAYGNELAIRKNGCKFDDGLSEVLQFRHSSSG
jgi:hypothetical protein